MPSEKIRGGHLVPVFLAGSNPSVELTIATLSAQQALDANVTIGASLGDILGLSTIDKFGRNPDVDTAAEEDIWDGGGAWIPPTTARIHDVTSSSGNDTALGTGARTVEVFGLDSNFLEIDEVVTLDGTNDVVTVNSYTMIYRMVIRSAGSGEKNAGIITATAQTDNTVTAQINVGNNQTLMAIYQIPADKTGIILSWYASINRTTGSADSGDFKLLLKPFDEVFQVKRFIGLQTDGASYIFQPFTIPIIVQEKTIIKMGCVDVSSNNTDVSGGFDIVMIDN